MHKCILPLLLSFMLVACGQPLNGAYSDSMGLTTYTFKPNGTVIIAAMGAEVDATYEVVDGKVKISVPDHTARLVFDLNPDGSLKGPMGLTFTKQ